MGYSSFSKSLQGPGLKIVLDTVDFGSWHETVAGTLGHHRSQLISASRSFRAHFRVGEIGDLKILYLKGTGSLELVREQCDQALLWIPLRGITEEKVNGKVWLAEPGSALLFEPGDHLHGFTSSEIEGLSIMVPNQYLPKGNWSAPPLIQFGPIEQRLLAAGRDVARAAALGLPGSFWAADQLLDCLSTWSVSHDPNAKRERITAVRRRALVAQAREWMEYRLTDRFSMTELSHALKVSTRQLQYSFQEELGCTPMAETKRLRLHRLRTLLKDPSFNDESVAQLMERAGLLASGVTSADYRARFGELPRQTRAKQPLSP